MKGKRMIKAEIVEDRFYAACIKERVAVTVFLINGFQIKGVITAFDPQVVIIVMDGKQHMIYKHVISTIVPERPVDAGIS